VGGRQLCRPDLKIWRAVAKELQSNNLLQDVSIAFSMCLTAAQMKAGEPYNLRYVSTKPAPRRTLVKLHLSAPIRMKPSALEIPAPSSNSKKSTASSNSPMSNASATSTPKSYVSAGLAALSSSFSRTFGQQARSGASNKVHPRHPTPSAERCTDAALGACDTPGSPSSQGSPVPAPSAEYEGASGSTSGSRSGKSDGGSGSGSGGEKGEESESRMPSAKSTAHPNTPCQSARTATASDFASPRGAQSDTSGTDNYSSYSVTPPPSTKSFGWLSGKEADNQRPNAKPNGNGSSFAEQLNASFAAISSSVKMRLNYAAGPSASNPPNPQKNQHSKEKLSAKGELKASNSGSSSHITSPPSSLRRNNTSRSESPLTSYRSSSGGAAGEGEQTSLLKRATSNSVHLSADASASASASAAAGSAGASGAASGSNSGTPRRSGRNGTPLTVNANAPMSPGAAGSRCTSPLSPGGSGSGSGGRRSSARASPHSLQRAPAQAQAQAQTEAEKAQAEAQRFHANMLKKQGTLSAALHAQVQQHQLEAGSSPFFPVPPVPVPEPDPELQPEPVGGGGADFDADAENQQTMDTKNVILSSEIAVEDRARGLIE
jgi:hypothetical protein